MNHEGLLSSLRGHLKRYQLARISRTADGDDEILASVPHVRHRRTGLRRRQVHCTDFLSRRLVVGTQHRAAGAIRLLRSCAPIARGPAASLKKRNPRRGDPAKAILDQVNADAWSVWQL